VTDTSILVRVCGANFYATALSLHLTEISPEVYGSETVKGHAETVSDWFAARLLIQQAFITYCSGRQDGCVQNAANVSVYLTFVTVSFTSKVSHF
jgi:hypothetical protein